MAGTDMDISPYHALENAAFLNLWKACNESMVSREAFSSLPMPEGVEPKDAWKAIVALRRGAGTHVPGTPNELEPDIWFNLPRNELNRVQSIISRSSESSDLGRYVASRPYCQAYLQGLISEITVTLQADGHNLGYEQVRAIATGDTALRTHSERLIANYLHILNEESAGHRYRSTLDLHAQLKAQAHPPSEGHASTPVHPQDSARLKRLTSTIDLCLSQAPYMSAADALCLSAYIREAPRYRHITNSDIALFGSLLRKVFFIRCGNSCLSLLPLSREASGLRSSGPIGAFNDQPEELYDKATNSYDETCYDIAYISSIDRALAEFESFVLFERGRLDDVRLLVRNASALTYRQRDTLLALLEDSSFSFTYSSYMETYGVAYVTARTDLTGLLKQGFLYTVDSNRSLIYRGVPDLPTVVRTRLGNRTV